MIEKLKKIINHYGKQKQSFQAIEEMSELTKVIIKDWNRAEHNIDNYKDEIADVYVMLYQLMIINNLEVSDVMIHADKKIDRTIERMEKEIKWKKGATQ